MTVTRKLRDSEAFFAAKFYACLAIVLYSPVWCVILFISVLLLTGCVSTDAFCKKVKIHVFSGKTADSMTKAEVKQEVLYNRDVIELCGRG